ncbi:Protein MAIN-LIKE 2 [Linum perenne]
MGLDQIRGVLRLTPDPELITALIERWHPETDTFHLYHGETTITLEDIHFITGLSVDGLPVTTDNLIPTTNEELAAYVGSLLGKTPATSDLNSGRIKMTWLRSNFAYREGDIRDDDVAKIHQYCRAYIIDFLGSCVFADRSGAYAHLFFLPLLSGTTTDHVGDIGGWMAVVQVWALERHLSLARRIHEKRAWPPEEKIIPRMPL